MNALAASRPSVNQDSQNERRAVQADTTLAKSVRKRIESRLQIIETRLAVARLQAQRDLLRMGLEGTEEDNDTDEQEAH